MMADSLPFAQAGRLPHPDDNVAIAVRRLNARTIITDGERSYALQDTVLVGHRFAVQRIDVGEAVRSWGQPFGTATMTILPGEYVCNSVMLDELRHRPLDFTLPTAPNFADQIAPFVFDESRFAPAPPLPRHADTLTFDGYRRPDQRGVGTRNMILLLGTSSLTGGFVTALETRLKPLAERYPNMDGIVAIAHTEGSHGNPNNRELLLRTLAGFMVNPNVGAVLAVDQGGEAVNNVGLGEYLTQHQYPLEHLPHHFMSLSRSFQDDLETAAQIIESWLETVNAVQRTPEPVSELKIGLQCGGSDAFSGISGNPLAAWVAREVLRYGGAANLAETDELIGAETYIVSKVRDLATARKFLAFIERFKTWAAWHGHSAAGNPSGGNRYRGLYNIYLKSLGASAKKHPDVRLDYAIEYGEPMRESGFYFMDSPGNDLESIAGQVASGCNMIFFVTGNGSITNFPFVPTIKIVTTSERYHLLPDEMDVNAGTYLENTPLDELGAATLNLTVRVASGEPSAGERAGHAQVQIWRDWKQTKPVNVELFTPRRYNGQPYVISANGDVPNIRFPAFTTASGTTTEQVGLILPTSLCSGQIARICADALNVSQIGRDKGVSRFVTLVHTEGCGSTSKAELLHTLVGYLKHPFVRHALLLEHGCEMTHNGYFREQMIAQSLDPDGYGWASVQLDGGIHRVIENMTRWFTNQLAQDAPPVQVEVGLEAVRLALVTRQPVSDTAALLFARLTRWIGGNGGAVVLAENDPLLRHPLYTNEMMGEQIAAPTLGFADFAVLPGLHIMATDTRDWNEMLTGLGASGAEVFLALVDDHPMPAHPMIPLLQVTSDADAYQTYRADLDALLTDTPFQAEHLLDLLVDTLARRSLPRLSTSGNVGFQITRGLLGVSM
jgi:altronate dehydratase